MISTAYNGVTVIQNIPLSGRRFKKQFIFAKFVVEVSFVKVTEMKEFGYVCSWSVSIVTALCFFPNLLYGRLFLPLPHFLCVMGNMKCTHSHLCCSSAI